MDALAPASELRALVGSGELRRAGELLVERYATDVVSLCRSMVRQRELAEDLAQDVFSSAFANLRSYRAEASPRTWLLSIARNRCIDHLRREQREPWELGPDGDEPQTFADDAPLPAELLVRRTDVGLALDELAEAERALVVLRFRHGLDYPELATVFGLREGTVRMRLSRALAKMRQTLEAREQGFVAPQLGGARAAPQPVLPSPAMPASEMEPPTPPRAALPAAAAPPRAAPGAIPRAEGFVGRARRWLGAGAPSETGSLVAAHALGEALTPLEPELTESLRQRLWRLASALPGA